MHKTIPVALPGRAYDIHIGPGEIGRIGERLAALRGRARVVIASDLNVAPLWGPRLEEGLAAAGHDIIGRIAVEPGEGAKCWPILQSLADSLLDCRPDRKTVLLALGGGVVGDLMGFLAAITLRGIDFVQIPTTLLAMVDSSVGGKTGINADHGKNLIGAFHHPLLVGIDTDALSTLPPREMRAGYAEIVKYGLLGDAAFYERLDNGQARALLAGDPQALADAIATSCAAKAAIVVEDPEERGGRRALLNLGHTFGHALEAQGGYDGRLLHGEAVAAGQPLAFALSARLGHCPQEAASRIAGHLAGHGLPSRLADLPFEPDRSAMIAAMRGDKKAEGGRMTFILARAVGEAFVARDVPEDAVADVLGKAA